MNRREFLFSAGAMIMTSGCTTTGLFGRRPDLKFGVISDIHLTTPKSCAMLKRSLRIFRSCGVDAVVIPGDLTDWGLCSTFDYLKGAWGEVFGGTDVVPLFCTGNHDYEGWRYADMAMEMHANGYSKKECLVNAPGGMKACWEKAFGEPFDVVRVRSVKGYDFVSTEWGSDDAITGWMAANGGRLRGTKPFFFFRHRPIGGTTSDASEKPDAATLALADFPNAVSFTGHAHHPFIDERSIWQGGFTAIAVPSLSYASIPRHYENGFATRTNTQTETMPKIPERRDLRGGQGYLVSVWQDRMILERLDLEENDSDAPDWEVPLPAIVGGAKPYAFDTREKAAPCPTFPCGAKLEVETRNTETRSGPWAIVMNCEFPTAGMPDGTRVYDYEIRAVKADGTCAVTKRFLSPAYARLAKYEPARQRFWFNVDLLPVECDYRLEVRARNCFGGASEPLVSRVLHGVSD